MTTLVGRLAVALACCFPILSAFSTAAETISIDSGFLGARLPDDFSGPFSLTAPDFSIRGGTFVTRFGYPVRAGFPADLNPTFFVSSAPGSCFGPCGPRSFQVELHGATFSEPHFRYSGQFNFSSLIPSVQTGNNTVPFAFSGNLLGRNVASGQEVFNLALTGGGMATINVRTLGFSSEVFSFAYNFEPIPEPSTLFLLASGLTALAVSRWRGSKGRS